MQLSGKTAIVTGSAVGVGRATALELAKRGANVVVNYSRSEQEALETAARVERLGTKALLVRADVSQDREVRSMVERALDAFGSIQVLVNNAAATAFVNFADLEGLTEEHWDRILAVNLKGPFFCARAVAGPMKEAGEGAIVNIASVAGIRAVGSSIAYAASKAGLINLTVALARVLAPQVRVNCVAPGFIDTRWLREGLGPLFEPARQRTAEQTPLGRVATPEDIAQVVLGLIEGADFVTGQTVVVDGGNMIRW
ncbi:MAG: 3-ketoacyl-ACP reductase [Chloroflexi bacterium RBG_16_68_14]|nr:MAG: 3-ketoacyl-ACP reductase [Chloroflexi bacterium RBG_16_68_14]